MRLIALDTETTGSSPQKGDRCVDIGLVEIVDGEITGRCYQAHLNPDWPVSWGAERIHGLSDAFLSDKPRLRDVAGDILDFIGDAPCFAHNARFDRDMLLWDFHHAGLPIPALTFFDSLPLMRQHCPVGPHGLDALAQSQGLTTGPRTLHGALEDADILARLLCRVEAECRWALATWVRKVSPLSPLPKSLHAFQAQAVNSTAGPPLL